jgi:chromosome segregation ATPase
LNVAQAAWDAERAEAEKLRVELSSAFEAQGAELEAVKVKLAEAEGRAAAAAAAADAERVESARQVAALTDSAHTATARVQEIEKRAEDLKAALASAQAVVQRVTAELEAERAVHGKTREALTAVSTELVTVKARFEAQAGVTDGQALRLQRAETELTQARESAAAAREEAAQWRGQAEALKLQQAQLMEALTVRGEKPAPKAGKK